MTPWWAPHRLSRIRNFEGSWILLIVLIGLFLLWGFSWVLNLL